MIPFFDQFVDTREKRYHILLLTTIACCLLMTIFYFLLGCSLIKLHDYDSLFALLDEPILNMNYLSRLIVDVMSLASFNIVNLLVALWQNIHWFDGITLLLVLLIFQILKKKKVALLCMGLLMMEFTVIILCTWMGMLANSLSSAVLAIRGIGLTLLLSHSIYAVLLLRYGYIQFTRYRKDMQYGVIEIKEHME